MASIRFRRRTRPTGKPSVGGAANYREHELDLVHLEVGSCNFASGGEAVVHGLPHAALLA